MPIKSLLKMSSPTLCAAGLAAAVLCGGSAHAATVHFSNIVPVADGVMDFEDAGEFMNGLAGFVRNGIRIDQPNGEPGVDIWTESGLGDGRSWYPDAGDNGWTRIRRFGGGNFDAVAMRVGAGVFGGDSVYFELADNGAVVLSGTYEVDPDGFTVGSWFGFAGGDFDEVRFRAHRGWLTGLDHCPMPIGEMTCNTAWVDDIRVGPAVFTVPSPSSAALAWVAVWAAGRVRRRRASAG